MTLLQSDGRTPEAVKALAAEGLARLDDLHDVAESIALWLGNALNIRKQPKGQGSNIILWRC